MIERNTERQPHEFRPTKMERVIVAVKNNSAEKIDLVMQRLYLPMVETKTSTFFLRFWRLAEGVVSLQEIPMSFAEIGRLGLGIERHMRKELEKLDAAVEEALQENAPAAEEEAATKPEENLTEEPGENSEPASE